VRTKASIGICLAAGLLLPAATPHAAERPRTLLDWLPGCWERSAGGLLTEEQWMARRGGGGLLGMSRTVRADTLVEYEFLRIAETDSGLVYIAHPSGQAETHFRLEEADGQQLVFSHPGHDFPQRILYRRVGPDSLEARIEGVVDGRERGVSFRYRRAECPGSSP